MSTIITDPTGRFAFCYYYYFCLFDCNCHPHFSFLYATMQLREAYALLDPRPALLEASLVLTIDKNVEESNRIKIGYFSHTDVCVQPWGQSNLGKKSK